MRILAIVFFLAVWVRYGSNDGVKHTRMTLTQTSPTKQTEVRASYNGLFITYPPNIYSHVYIFTSNNN